jgi:hypothetical protein
MSELMVYSQVPNQLDAVRQYGEIIANAKFFGCSNVAQGQALVLMAMGEGVPITEMRRKYHIVGGTELSMRADYMRAEFRRLGGEYWWIDQGDDGKQAVMRVKYKGNDLEVRYTIENAQQEGLIKSGSRWTKSPGDMLRARVSTKAIRMVCSEVLAGFPSEEELGFDGADAERTIEAKVVPPAVQALRDAVAKTPQADAPQNQGPAFVADGEVLASGEQINTINELFKALGIQADRQSAAIRKRGAKDMGDLTETQADDLIASLVKLSETRVEADVQIEEAAGETKADPEAAVLPVNSPAIQPQIDDIKRAMREIAQMDGQADIGERVKKKLASCGLAKLNDLSFDEAEVFKTALARKSLDAFFDMELRGTRPF